MPRSIFSCYSIHARLAIVTTFAARCSRRGPKGGRRRVSPNSFGEGTSSEEGSRRSTPSSICIRTQAAVQSARDLTLIRFQRRQVERDRRGQPNFPRFVGKPVCPNGQKFETSCLPATHRRLSLLRDSGRTRLSNFLRPPRIFNAYKHRDPA